MNQFVFGSFWKVRVNRFVCSLLNLCVCDVLRISLFDLGHASPFYLLPWSPFSISYVKTDVFTRVHASDQWINYSILCVLCSDGYRNCWWGELTKARRRRKIFLTHTLSYVSFSAFSEEEHWFRAKGFHHDKLLKIHLPPLHVRNWSQCAQWFLCLNWFNVHQHNIWLCRQWV